MLNIYNIFHLDLLSIYLYDAKFGYKNLGHLDIFYLDRILRVYFQNLKSITHHLLFLQTNGLLMRLEKLIMIYIYISKRRILMKDHLTIEKRSNQR